MSSNKKLKKRKNLFVGDGVGIDELKKGGTLKGPSHEKGGIPIEAEGGEYIIKKKSVNKSTIPYLEYINSHGKLPSSIDARKRRK